MKPAEFFAILTGVNGVNLGTSMAHGQAVWAAFNAILLTVSVVFVFASRGNEWNDKPFASKTREGDDE